MDGSSTWLTIFVSLITALSGAGLFKFLYGFILARMVDSRKARDTEREALDADRAAFKAEQSEWWAEQRKAAQSDRLENRTYRDAMNDQSMTLGRLEGENTQLKYRIGELEAEVDRLRGGHDD